VLQLVPDLEQAEYKREREFYLERGLPCPKVLYCCTDVLCTLLYTVQDLEAETEKDEKQAREEMDQTPDMDTNMDFHRFDEQVLFCSVLYHALLYFTYT
jgi:hypothetical protein